MSESHASKQEQQSQVEAVEVVIGGKVFRKTILPAVTRQDALNKSGGIKNLPKQSRQLTDQEKQVLDESSREGQSAHDRNFRTIALEQMPLRAM